MNEKTPAEEYLDALTAYVPAPVPEPQRYPMCPKCGQGTDEALPCVCKPVPAPVPDGVRGWIDTDDGFRWLRFGGVVYGNKDSRIGRWFETWKIDEPYAVKNGFPKVRPMTPLELAAAVESLQKFLKKGSA